MSELDLFLDESGQFTELDPGGNERQRFPSQLAGLVAPTGGITREAALEVLAVAQRAADLPLAEEVHGAALPPGEVFDRLIGSLLTEIARRGWQPVRLVNAERVAWGGRSRYYTAMVAELAVRVVDLETVRRGGEPPSSVHLDCAIVWLADDERGDPIFLERDEYLARLEEQRAFACVRRGAARNASAWRLDLRLASGRKRPELQLCDLISNASHGDFGKCGPALRERFRAALGPYDQTLALRVVPHRAREAMGDGSLGLAVRILAETRCDPHSPDPAAEREIERLLADAVRALSRLEAPWRDVQLGMLTGWLEQLVEQSRQLALGHRLAKWLLERVEAPLREWLPPEARPTVDWFAFVLHRLALTASNHRGALRDARAATRALEELGARIAGRWEHATPLMEGLIAQAVHLTDCLEYEAAARKMGLVAKYYEDLASLAPIAFEGLFGERVRSDLRGKALGTWLQAETLAAVRDRRRIADARRISELAIDEFTAPSDKRRQYQYRCHLETVAGDFATAREFLARSIDAPAATHVAIAHSIGSLPPPRQGFPLLHWLRLGSVACLDGPADEREAFGSALDAARVADSEWVTADGRDYPAHGIRRYLATILAARRRFDAALSVLGRLRALRPEAAAEAILAVELAAGLAEVAALCVPTAPHHARRLLDDARKPPGLLRVLADLEGVPELAGALAAWRPRVDRVLAERTSDAAQELLAAGRAMLF